MNGVNYTAPRYGIFSSFLLLLRRNNSPQNSVTWYPAYVFFLQGRNQISYPYKTEDKFRDIFLGKLTIKSLKPNISAPQVSPSAWNTAMPTGQIFQKFYDMDFPSCLSKHFLYWTNSIKNGHWPWCVFEISSILFYGASWGCRNSWASVTIAYRVLKQWVVYWNTFMNLKLRYDKGSKGPKIFKKSRCKEPTRARFCSTSNFILFQF
jgi:hypothetical protein